MTGEATEMTDPKETAATRLVRIPVGSSLADAERELILATLESCQGNKSSTAKVLGISLKTLYNRLNNYSAEGDRQQA